MPLVRVYANNKLQFSSKLAKTSFVGFCNRLAECTDSVLLGLLPASEGVAPQGQIDR